MTPWLERFVLWGVEGADTNIFVSDAGTTNYFPYPEGHKYVGNFSKPATLRCINFSVGLKKYKRGYLAPIGLYRKFEAVLIFEKLKYDYQNFAIPDPNSSNYPYAFVKDPLGTGEYSYFNMSFACTFGKQIALNDKIIESDDALHIARLTNLRSLGYLGDHVEIEEHRAEFFEMARSYVQMNVPLSSIENGTDFLHTEAKYIAKIYEGEVIFLQLPPKITLEVTETPDAVKGDTTSGAYKDATLETGAVVKVPLFIKSGQKIIVNTEDRAYFSKE